MRYLIGALCAVALLFSAAPKVVAAATVGCGRVTTFVGPNAAGSLPGGDGWVIFVKPDGSSDKVILRAGTQVGTLSGYICIGSEGVYSTGVIAPGAAGYIAEPAVSVTPGTAVYCGTVAANSTTSGQGSGPRTFELRVPSGPGGGFPFSVSPEDPLPTIGNYLCGRFRQGVPTNGLLAVLRVGDPGYVAAGLPNTSTAAGGAMSLLSLAGLVLIAALSLLGLRMRRNANSSGRSPKNARNGLVSL